MKIDDDVPILIGYHHSSQASKPTVSLVNITSKEVSANEN
jgi:hypothetical protein